MLAEGAAAPERAVEIDVDDVQPVFVGDLFGGRFASRDPCIIDEDIDLAVPCRKLIRHLGDASGIRHVHDDDLGIVAFCLEGGAAGLGRLRIPIGNDDFRPRLCQRFPPRKSDSLASACDDSDAATKSEFFQIHLLLFLVTGRSWAKSRRYTLFVGAAFIAFRRYCGKFGRADGIVCSLPNNLSLLVKTVQAGWIRRKPHTVAGFQTEFSDAARRKQSELPGVDIEEGVAAEMLGDRYGPGPAFSLSADLHMFGPDADGGDAMLAGRLPGHKVHLGRTDEAGDEKIGGAFVE